MHEPMILPKAICFSVKGVVSRMGHVWASFSEVILVAAEEAVRNKQKKKKTKMKTMCVSSWER